MKGKRFISIIPLVLLTVLIYWRWFIPGVISTGDFLPFPESFISTASLYPYAWGWNFAVGGLGGFTAPFLWLHFIQLAPIYFLGTLGGFDWNIIQKVYLYPLLVLLSLSPLLFFRFLFPKNPFSIFSSLIYAFNTYILLLISGGQIYIALAYSIVPLIFLSFFTLTRFSLKKIIISGFILSFQFMLDLRIALVTCCGLGLYYLCDAVITLLRERNIKKNIAGVFSKTLIAAIPFVITLLLHFYWILPSILVRQNPLEKLGEAYTTTSAVTFFSFAEFENTLSLLHPNWPENIFGLTHFMRPEFLLIPLLAFLSLLFIQKKSTREKFLILFFSLLAMIGAFLAKGTREPFGQLYLWLFENLPGFQLFRDPTKWYLLVALSYSVLIPFSISELVQWVKDKSKSKRPFAGVLVVGIFLYFVYLIHPVILGQFEGTRKGHGVPIEYQELENQLSKDKSFYRTLWVPTYQRYGYYSDLHPAIFARQFFLRDRDELITKRLSDRNTLTLLQNAGIRYIIVPFDSEKEIFIKDRKYDNSQYLSLRDQLRKTPWLKESEIGQILLFEVPNPKDHFWIEEREDNIVYNKLNSTKYVITVKEVQKGETLVFSESFDPNWKIVAKNKEVASQQYDTYFNSFLLPESGNYNIILNYPPQKWVDLGLVISVGSFIVLFGSLLFLHLKRKKYGH